MYRMRHDDGKPRHSRRQAGIHSRNRRIRPTTSRTLAALISILGPSNIVGQRCVDLYAGTGGVGIEFLKRGALRVDFVEQDRRRATRIEADLAKHQLVERAAVHRADAIRWLTRDQAERCEILFADPPYETQDLGKLINAITQSERIAHDATVVIEHSSRVEPPHLLPSTLKHLETRTYGDSALTFYRINRNSEA